MNRFKGLVLALVLALVWQAQAEEPFFADVPPCHWAADAVNRLAETGIFIGFPADHAYLSVNALQQVFAGLWCEEPSWSLRFLHNAPADFGAPDTPRVLRYELEPVLSALEESRAVIDFTVLLVLQDDGAERTITLSGTAIALRDEGAWRIDYDSIAELEPALFPPFEPGQTLAPIAPGPTATFRGD